MYSATKLDVDVMPVLCCGGPGWHGRLVSQDDGSCPNTSIPLHLEFCRKRKQAQEQHFAQVRSACKFALQCDCYRKCSTRRLIQNVQIVLPIKEALVDHEYICRKNKELTWIPKSDGNVE